MTDTTRDHDFLDRLTAEIRDQQLDDAVVDAAAARVWSKIESEFTVGEPLRSCDDVRALLPAFVDGELGESRALLVGDHTRECVGCRRALLELKGGVAPTAPARSAAPTRRGLPLWLKAAAALVLMIGGGSLAVRIGLDRLADHRLTAHIASRGGSVQLIGNDRTTNLAEGAELRAGQRVRTTRNDGAFIRLADGSMIEMAPRSELRLRGSRRGTTVALERGNIIVHAADQGRGRLAVRTDECEVAVKGTIFAVNHGLKGSRVSVIEGEVEVRHGGAHERLRPGDQVTTDDRLRAVAITDEIAWSANADDHRRLLAELTTLQHEVAEAVDIAQPRTSTRLLDLTPHDTAFYVAMPNLTEGLGAARRVFDSRIASSELLREWWQREIVANGVDRKIEDALDRLQVVGDCLGDEVVVALTASGLSGEGDPLFLAELDDRAGFRALLDRHLASHPDGAAPVQIVDRPDQAVADGVELVIWLGDDIVAAARTTGQIRALADRMAGSQTGEHGDSELRRELRRRYADGVEWLFGADLAWIVDQARAEGGPDEIAVLERAGLLETETLILERHRAAAGSEIDAELRFSGIRRGVAAWLAEPAPLATLDFISTDATVVTAAAAKDGLELFDELLALASSAGPDALSELDALETELGVDLRDDLAAALGGEGSFALDGPVLPVPTWKLVLEVYDPATLDHTIRTVIDRANAELAASGAAAIDIVETTVSGLEVTSIRHPSSPLAISYALTDGFLVAGSSPAAVEHAIRVRSAGMGLARSAGFRALLPDNGFTDASAIVYRNLEPIVGMMPSGAMSPELEGYERLLRDGAAPGLFCVYGLDDRIIVSGTGPSFAALAPLLGIVDTSVLEQLVPDSADRNSEPVSSGS